MSTKGYDTSDLWASTLWGGDTPPLNSTNAAARPADTPRLHGSTFRRTPIPRAAADPPGTRTHRTLPRPCKPHTERHNPSSWRFVPFIQRIPPRSGHAPAPRPRRAAARPPHGRVTRPSSAKPSTRRHGVPGTLGGDARSVLGRDRRVISCW